MLAYVLLGIAQVVGLALIPAGYPGVWLQLAAIAAFGWWSGFPEAGVVPLAILTVIALSAEITTFVAAGDRSDPELRRAGSWTLAGGVGGAMAGHGVPVMGGLFGAVIGALLGLAVGRVRERLRRTGNRVRALSPSPTASAMLGLVLRVAAGVVVATVALLESPAGN